MSKLLQTALNDFGLREIPGQENNPQILKYFHDIGHTWVPNDETAWCSAAVNYWAMKVGLERSGKLNARSWLDVGKSVNNPMPGDVVVFWRESESSWKGHVGIYITTRGDDVYCLGGNQRDQVNISAYHKVRVLSYRHLGPAK